MFSARKQTDKSLFIKTIVDLIREKSHAINAAEKIPVIRDKTTLFVEYARVKVIIGGKIDSHEYVYIV